MRAAITMGRTFRAALIDPFLVNALPASAEAWICQAVAACFDLGHGQAVSRDHEPSVSRSPSGTRPPDPCRGLTERSTL